jgi:ribonuclease BN (tRNA processing enzyme)
MTNTKLKIVGCGDAFGTGGLHTTCFYLKTDHAKCLIDIGVGSLPNLKMMEINPSEIDLIVLSHFHGDHFGGMPNFLLDAAFVQDRKKGLTIVGPVGVEKKFGSYKRLCMEAHLLWNLVFLYILKSM